MRQLWWTIDDRRWLASAYRPSSIIHRQNDLYYKEDSMSRHKSEIATEYASPDTAASPDAIAHLIANLTNRDVRVRARARQALVTIGHPAIERLTAALQSPDAQVRWEAAKAFGEIGHPAAAPALVNALEDQGFDIRWLAAQALIVLGRAGWLREGAHRVVRALIRKKPGYRLALVLETLEGCETASRVRIAAYVALEALNDEETKAVRV
jgi:HEAT repeat protein